MKAAATVANLLEESVRHERAADWEAAVRAAFLDGYFGDPARPADYLPRERAHADAIVALFEIEKLFYELAYEVNNRPAWAWIPLRGILRLPAR